MPQSSHCTPAELVLTLSREELRELVKEAMATVLELSETKEEPPALLTKKAAARALSTSTSTLDRLVASGMPFIRIGDVKRFELGACLEWLRRGKGA